MKFNGKLRIMQQKSDGMSTIHTPIPLLNLTKLGYLANMPSFLLTEHKNMSILHKILNLNLKTESKMHTMHSSN